MCNREISSRRIDWFFPRSSTAIRGRSPGGGGSYQPPPLTVRVMRNALTGRGLTWAGHEIDLTSGHEHQKSKIYKLYELLALSSSKSLKTLGSELWLWQCVKLLNCVLRWRHLTWPGDLTWYDLGSKFLHQMRKGWMNSYAKFGSAPRRRLSAAVWKTDGGTYICAPDRARVKERSVAWPLENAGGFNSLTLGLRGHILAQLSSGYRLPHRPSFSFFFKYEGVMRWSICPGMPQRSKCLTYFYPR